MNRRAFFKRLLGAGIAIAAAPTLLEALTLPPAPVPVVTFRPPLSLFNPSAEVYERYITPAATALAERIDADLALHIWPPLYGPGVTNP